MQHCSLYQYRQSAGSPFQWTSSSGSSKTFNGVLVFVDRFIKMVHLAAVKESISAQGCARVFIDTVFRLHGLPRELVSDRDPRFTAAFWQSVFQSLGARLTIYTSDHPETDGQNNASTASSKRYFEVTSNLLQIGANSYQWRSFPSITLYMLLTTHTPSTPTRPFKV